MGGGPFRDTVTPLIGDAQRRLAELRQERARLEEVEATTQRYGRVEKKGNPSAVIRFFRGFAFGVAVGLPFATCLFLFRH